MANRFKKAAEARQEKAAAATPTPETPAIKELKPLEENKVEDKTSSAPTDQEPAPLDTPSAHRKNKIEEEDLIGISLRIPIGMRDALRLRYAKTGEKMTAYIRRLIEEDMRNNPF